jgi:hypothetical protein
MDFSSLAELFAPKAIGKKEKNRNIRGRRASISVESADRPLALRP